MVAIHPTAIVDERACLAADVDIGAYSIIGPTVEIGSGTWVGPHVVIEGHTRIGCNNRIFQFCSLGAIPQDKKYAGEPTRLDIGDNNTIREFCTFNIGTVGGDSGVTRLGNDNWIMAYVHIAHDCQIGNHTVFANNATLAGHVTVEDWVILGGFTSVHQFTRIGDHAMTAFASAVAKDVPPFVLAAGNRAAPLGINTEGLERRGFSPTQIRTIRSAYKTLYRCGLSYGDARQKLLEAAASQEELEPFIRFFAKSKRSIIR